MDFPKILEYFWVAIPLACMLWVGRLRSIGLATRYPLLMALLCGELFFHVAGFVIYQMSGPGDAHRFYLWFWLISRVATSTLYLFVVLQIYQRMVDRYRGFHGLGQLVVYGSLAGAALVLFSTIFLDPSADLRKARGFWIVEERGVYAALTLILLLLLWFGSYFRLYPPRNVMILFAVFGVFFVAQSFLWGLRNYLGSEFRMARDLVGSVLYFVCLCTGALAFSAAGEGEVSLALPDWVTGERAQRDATSHLEAINQTLVRMLRL